ncbi:uncharacterized protein LOC110629191 [Manihot esculenta]|uniref:uncharacterized protein LOC110629191 n=1 Tax=Manihot esculenta TaxID=3983 RepID=UPI000B5D4F9D|nr:uncharacterized protein LOC110629191 [Manihot esculenta]
MQVIIQPPFPKRLIKFKKDEDEKEPLELFSKIEKKLVGNERTSVGENISIVSQRKLPPKCKDQGMLAISCKIDGMDDKRAMCDLGASINVMPLSIYNSLNIPLNKTSVIIQLTDKSMVYLKGVLKNILVQVGGLDFLTDFYIFDIKEDKSSNFSDILFVIPY